MNALTLAILAFVIAAASIGVGYSAISTRSQLSINQSTSVPVAQSSAVPDPSGNKTVQINKLTINGLQAESSPPSSSVNSLPIVAGCEPDSGHACSQPQSCNLYLVTCASRKCTQVVNGPGAGISYHARVTCGDNGQYDVNNLEHIDSDGTKYVGWCNSPELVPTTAQFTTCMAKPVIYLYPQKDTYTDVFLDIPGLVVKSIPEYKNGWEEVSAHPNGQLDYQGQTYNELFYESAVSKASPPEDGIIINKKYLKPNLNGILLKLGLNQTETNEFLDYWMPQLTAQKGDYLLFSIFDKQEKDRVDHVVINPEPDTRIEILAYFKPLDKPIEIKPLILPENPPQRVGFTEVEWGGTIDY